MEIGLLVQLKIRLMRVRGCFLTSDMKETVLSRKSFNTEILQHFGFS